MNHRWIKIVILALAFTWQGCSKKDAEGGPSSTTTTTDTTGGGQQSKSSYFELSFAGEVDEVNNFNDIGKHIQAIGANGDGSAIYLAFDDTRDIRIYDPVQNAVPPLVTIPPGKNLIGTYITRIVRGPGNKALAVSKNSLAILELAGDKITGIWKNNEIDASGTIKPQTAAVCGNQWVAFVSGGGKLGIHRTFGQTTGAFGDGPRASVAKPIVASVCSGGALYLAQNEDGSISSISKYTGALNGAMDTAHDKEIMSQADLEIINPLEADISGLAVVGDYLIIGKIASSTEKYGIGLLKLSTNEKIPFQSDMGIPRYIEVSHDNKTALIGTDNGLVFFHNGQLINIADSGVNDYQRLTTALLDTNRIAFTNAKDAGFYLNSLGDIGAVHVGEYWYVVVQGKGIFKIKMVEKLK